MRINQWASRIFVVGKPITITMQDIFVKNDDDFIEFIDQNNEHRILRSGLIEVPTFIMY